MTEIKCRCCKQMQSLELFGLNPMGKSFKTCNTCRTKRRDNWEKCNTETKQCPRCKRTFRSPNWILEHHLITWVCYKTTITNPTQEKFYKWLYDNKDDELFKKVHGRNIEAAIFWIDEYDSELDTMIENADTNQTDM